MKKRPTQESETSAASTPAILHKFTGTDNPRHLRTIAALLRRSMPRQHIDGEAGCSNGPELIAELRRRGLEVPCVRIEAIDRDGKLCKPGVYSLTEKDRRKIHRWMASRQNGGIDSTLAGLVAMACVCVVLLAGVVMKPKAPLNLLIDIRGWQEQTATLTSAETGAFLKLKMHYWRVSQIPDRDTALAQIVGMGIKEWKEAREGLEPLFIVGNGEWLRTDWCEELEAAYVAIRKYSEASKTANKARWDKQKNRLRASDSESDSESRPESGKDSVSHPASLLKYKGNPPSQEKEVFDPSAVELEQAVSALESGWKEVASV